MNTRITPYLQLMRFHKPIGILLLLWPTWWALWIAAHGFPSIKNAVVFTLGVVIMRSAGCVINDIADRHFDLHVTRTQQRPITAGIVSVRAALILFGILCVIAGCLVLLTNTLTITLAVFALLTAILYPFMKRYTHWPQFILGIAYSFSIPMAFAAQTQPVSSVAIVLMIANMAWTIAYDTEYAMVDRAEDVNIGIKSTAVLFGQYDRLIISMLQGITLLLLCVIGRWQNFSFVYFIGLFGALMLFIYQQRLIAKREPAACFQAFLNNQWVGLIILTGIVMSVSG